MTRQNTNTNDISIIAMECRIPQANNVNELWELLLKEHCIIEELSNEQVINAGVQKDLVSHPAYVKRAGVLEEVDKFDADYFDMNAREADILDVQQRMMLEASVTLLNQGNIDPARTKQRIGVFAGSGFSSYLFGVLEQGELVEALGEMLVRHSNDKDFLANRISYKLNLQGPSVNVQTSCSTGLVAVHSAIQSLLLGECDLAIAGAVYIRLPQHAGYKYQPDGVLSADGVCRPFDAKAQGTIFTNGLGLVLLKRTRDAIDDGDDIIATIAGSAINNDGSNKVGFTAPSVSGQIDVLTEALAISGVSPNQVQFIEAHGTGTALGDPIEVEAIRQAYGPEGLPCAIGSLKGNFGHFNIAAGIIGLIKAALVLKKGIIPSTIHLQKVNPLLELENSRFFIANKQTHLDMDKPRYAAVSAFGMGGTNCHLILRSNEPSKDKAPSPVLRPQLLTFSAKSNQALDRMSALFAEFLQSNPEISIADAAYTSMIGRPQLAVRGAVVAQTPSETISRLKTGHYMRGQFATKPPLAFIFGGQGTQQLGMGRNLAQQWSPFLENLECALDVLNTACDIDLRDILWNSTSESDLRPTNIAQPLIFAVEYALAQSLISASIHPDYMMGHSLGEVVAATISGVFDLKTAGTLVAMRAQTMAAAQLGAMLCVSDIEPFTHLLETESLALASKNSPKQYVLSGPTHIIEEAQTLALARGIPNQRLKTSHAFHSPMLDSAAKTFGEFLKTINFGTARVPIISNITGNILTEYEYRNPTYWADHVVKTVQFAASTSKLLDLDVRHFIEIGSGHTMSNLLRANLIDSLSKEVVIVSSMDDVEDEYSCYLEAVALGWTLSPNVDINPHIDGQHKISLPVYPFSRDTHWIEPVIGFQPRYRQPQTESNSANSTLPAKEQSTPTKTDKSTDVATNLSNQPQRMENNLSNPVEGLVSDIYQTFLGNIELSTSSSFFELGGNSLLAIQLVNRLRETFQVDIPLRGFYQNSSVVEISNQIAHLLLQEPADV